MLSVVHRARPLQVSLCQPLVLGSFRVWASRRRRCERRVRAVCVQRASRAGVLGGGRAWPAPQRAVVWGLHHGRVGVGRDPPVVSVCVSLTAHDAGRLLRSLVAVTPALEGLCRSSARY